MSELQFNPKNWDAKPKNITVESVFEGAVFNPRAAVDALKKQKLAKLAPLDAPLGLIKTTSFSSLSNFESCPWHLYLSKVEKCPDVAGAAAQRGNKIHDQAEKYITGETVDDRVPKELLKFEELFKDLRSRYSEGVIHVEEDWGFTREWEKTDYHGEDVWLRMKLDALDMESPTSAIVYDWKTGQRWNNEIKHGQQALLYVIGTFALFPELEYIQSNMVYLDKGGMMTSGYTRDQAMLFFDRYNLRFNQATTCVDFKPTPNASSCKWCAHAKVQEGFEHPACQWRYIKQ